MKGKPKDINMYLNQLDLETLGSRLLLPKIMIVLVEPSVQVVYYFGFYVKGRRFDSLVYKESP